MTSDVSAHTDINHHGFANDAEHILGSCLRELHYWHLHLHSMQWRSVRNSLKMVFLPNYTPFLLDLTC